MSDYFTGEKDDAVECGDEASIFFSLSLRSNLIIMDVCRERRQREKSEKRDSMKFNSRLGCEKRA